MAAKIGHIVMEETRKKIGLKHKGKKSPYLVERNIKNNPMHNLKPEVKLERSRRISESLIGNKRAVGHKPWTYIDGRSKLVAPGRYGSEWKNIRKAVLIRDNFTCQNCSKINVKFDIHHKISFLLTKDNSLDNLITLCDICHRKEETRIIKELKLQGEN